MKIKLGLGDDGPERLQRDASWLSAPDGIGNLRLSRPAVADIDFALIDFSRRVAHRAQDPAPVWIAAKPARFHERAVRHRASDTFGVGCRPGSMDVQRNEARYAFPVAHDHFRQL